MLKYFNFTLEHPGLYELNTQSNAKQLILDEKGKSGSNQTDNL